jgi:asparagine synthase (glutamine-hydrolysing)
MCGLAGYVDTTGRRRPDRRTLELMTDTLVHRGPDSVGFFVDEHVALAFRRLAIVGLADGDQPLRNEDGSVVVCCNGEIFNHLELREELEERGHALATSSDVEVLSHLYEESGDDLVHRLNGQFSLALYDRTRRRLLLARDHFGITPLHFALAGGVLVFASEIKALLEHPDVPREVDLAGLDQVLTLPGLVSPCTMFRGVSSLPPGHLLTVEDGDVRMRRYWDLDYPRKDDPPSPDDEETQLERLAAALRRSVALRMRADVDHAYYLSGGLDSSLIAALAAPSAPGPLRSFSVAFTDPALSEHPHQRVVADHLRTDHTELWIGPEDLVEALATVVRHCECPLRESYNGASLLLSRKVHEHGLKVVLTGEGSDELFAGYVGYRFDRAAERRQRRPGEPLSPEEELRARLWCNPALAYQGDLLGLRERKRALYSREVAARMEDFEATREPLVDLGLLEGRDVVHQRSYLDFKLRLADHLLGDHGDRMALAHSVEARYPFLDVDVVECARQMPPGLKLRGFEEKFAVKRVADGLVPPPILEREKFAFAADASPALLRAKRARMDELLDPARIRREGYFDADEIIELRRREECRSEGLNLVFEDDALMVVITFQLFLEAFDLA